MNDPKYDRAYFCQHAIVQQAEIASKITFFVPQFVMIFPKC